MDQPAACGLKTSSTQKECEVLLQDGDGEKPGRSAEKAEKAEESR